MSKRKYIQFGTILRAVIEGFRRHVPKCSWDASEGPSQLSWTQVHNASIS